MSVVVLGLLSSFSTQLKMFHLKSMVKRVSMVFVDKESLNGLVTEKESFVAFNDCHLSARKLARHEVNA